ncbi:MAG TPA: hypothetical protein V6D18_09375 [Thermosynechococcaceae cyanobacterium]
MALEDGGTLGRNTDAAIAVSQILSLTPSQNFTHDRRCSGQLRRLNSLIPVF